MAGRTFIAGAGALVLAACGGNNGTGPSSSAVPPDSVQQQIAQTLAASIQAQVASFTQLGAGAFFTPFLSFDVTSSHGFSALRRRLTGRSGVIGTHAFAFGLNCPTVSPQVPGDADNDGVPDAATFTYNTANCSDTANGEVITISGAVIAGDPTSTPDLNDNEQLQNVVINIAGPQDNARFAGNGGYSIAETSGQVTNNMDFWLALRETTPHALYDSLSIKGGETFNFQAGGQPLILDSQLPPGTLQINATETFTESGQTTYTFTIATPTMLTVDPTCLSTITAGILTITFSGSKNAVETITWNGCGNYTVTHS